MTSIIVPTIVSLSLAGNKPGSEIIRKVPAVDPSRSDLVDVLADLYQGWFQISSVVRFFVSGSVGTVCFFFLERLVYVYLSNRRNLPSVVEGYKETVSYFIGYFLQIVTQHWLHAFLVYGFDTINTREKYFRTLLGQFYAYGIAMFGSTILNLFLIRSGIEKTTAFFVTMAIFACINYYLVGWIVKRAVDSSNASSTSSPRKQMTSIKRQAKQGGARSLVKGIQRGGFIWLPERESYKSTRSVHDAVLDTACLIDVDIVNKM